VIGNDVIDLRQSRLESNWQRIGLLQKLFTEEEQLFITNNLDSEISIWILWSMKEAAYKIRNRHTKLRAFMPKKLVCTLQSQNSTMATGLVMCDGSNYYTKTTLSNELIHTVAVNLLNNLDLVVEIERKDVLKDEHGIPYIAIVEDGQYDRKAVSISNHGRFEKVVTIRTK
jgi:phosphopantetheinyl transferase (holo-ACP synthase)